VRGLLSGGAFLSSWLPFGRSTFTFPFCQEIRERLIDGFHQGCSSLDASELHFQVNVGCDSNCCSCFSHKNQKVEMNIEKSLITLADRVIDLETVRIRQDAQIAVLTRILSRVMSRESKKPSEEIVGLIHLECLEEHQRALETIENADPALSALLDRRREDQVP
jgi:hypothetical protein